MTTQIKNILFFCQLNGLMISLSKYVCMYVCMFISNDKGKERLHISNYVVKA